LYISFINHKRGIHLEEKHIKYYSHHLERDVEMLVYGSWGYPILLFPTTLGRYYQAKDMGLIESVAGWLTPENTKSTVSIPLMLIRGTPNISTPNTAF
jgi:hypothetical protein